jgi:DNA polymerase-3 subunit beta
MPGADGVRFLVPSRAVIEAARLAGDDEVGIEVSGSQVGFHLGNVLLQSRLIEGEFPAYRQLLPENLPNTLEFDKPTFLEALKRIAVLAQDATPVFVEVEPDAVRISCHSQGLGEGAEEVDATYTGEQMRVAFNPQYLETGIAAVESDAVRISMSDSQRPVLVRSIADDADAFVYLLMPIRVS